MVIKNHLITIMAFMMDSGMKVKCMDKVNLLMQIVMSMKVNL